MRNNQNQLEIANPELLVFTDQYLVISVLGGIKLNSLERMRVTLKIERKESQYLPIRYSLDLYYNQQLQQLVHKINEDLGLPLKDIQLCMNRLITALEEYRAKELEALKPVAEERKSLSEEEKKRALEYPSLAQAW